jgi:UDP:flavonoid glycosyltransferase YjiC (YdhE family)
MLIASKRLFNEVLSVKSYQQNALRLQDAIRQAGGINKAADIVEQAVSLRKPVCR